MSDQLVTAIVFVVYVLGLLVGLAYTAYWQGKWKAENLCRKGHYGYTEALEYELSGRVMIAVLWPVALVFGLPSHFIWKAGRAAWNKLEELGKRNASDPKADTSSRTN